MHEKGGRSLECGIEKQLEQACTMQSKITRRRNLLHKNDIFGRVSDPFVAS